MPLPGDIIPDYERVPVNDVQVSLHRLLKLLRSTGRSTGFLLSGAIVPIIDVRKLIEDEFAGSLDPSAGDTSEMYASAALIGGAAFTGTLQLFNPVGSGVVVQLMEAWLQPAVASTFNLELHDGAFQQAQANGVLVRGPAILSGANDDCAARLFEEDGTGGGPTRLKVMHQEATDVNRSAIQLCRRPLWFRAGRGVCVRDVANGAGTRGIVNYRFREFPQS